MSRRILALVGGHLALSAGLIALGRADAVAFGSPARVVAIGAAFGLVGLMPMHLELGRSACTLTLVEGVVVLALFSVGPLGVVVAAVAGEGVACATHRQSALKLAYNMSAVGLASTVAALGFAALGPPVFGPAAWGAALISVAAFAVTEHTSTSLVLTVSGEGPFDDVVRRSVGLAALASAVSGSVGLAVVALARVGTSAPLLLAPLIAVLGLETRREAAHHAQRLRIERLSLASSRTIGLQGLTTVLGQTALEARGLLTGAAAVCCGYDEHGVWQGMLADDRGAHRAPDPCVAAAVELAGDPACPEVAVPRLPTALRQALPRGVSAVVARADGVVLVVVRDIAFDGQGRARREILDAFAAHASLVVANALLFDRMEAALHRQVELGRHKDEFVAAVSHELRTPLASVLGAVDTVRRLDARLDPDSRERLFGIARRQGQRLRDMIEELLLTASLEHRHQRVTLAGVDLARLLQEIAEDVQEQSEGRVVVRVDDAARWLCSDAELLRKIVMNLVYNATKYAPEGPIEVLAAAGSIGETGRILVRVIDHGPGIAATDRAKVFERFVQLDGSSTRAHGGTGLGLFLCAQLAELLDATLTVGDTPQGGATFALSLPVSGRPDETEPVLSASVRG